jgi:branched-chain amino acid transport system ATP-binding protein
VVKLAVSEYLLFVVIGLTMGAVYGSSRVGFELTYRTSGILNFMKTIAGRIRPTAGRLEVFVQNTATRAANKLTRWSFCLILQGRGVYKSVTVAENLALEAAGRDAQSVEDTTQTFPALGRHHNRPRSSLSGGEQLFFVTTRSYIKKRRLILIDEASIPLAPIHTILSFMGQIASPGTSLLIVDQFVTRALALADHTYSMMRGYITLSGPPDDLGEGDIFERYVGGRMDAIAGSARRRSSLT